MENEKLETVVSDHADTLARHDEQIKQNCKDIIKIENQTEAINRLATSVELLAQQGSTTNEKIEKLDKKVDDKFGLMDDKFGKMDDTIEEIKAQPDKKDADKWREIVKYVLLFMLGAVLGIVAKKIGL